jgi:hypothetical protein
MQVFRARPVDTLRDLLEARPSVIVTNIEVVIFSQPEKRIKEDCAGS